MPVRQAGIVHTCRQSAGHVPAFYCAHVAQIRVRELIEVQYILDRGFAAPFEIEAATEQEARDQAVNFQADLYLGSVIVPILSGTGWKVVGGEKIYSARC